MNETINAYQWLLYPDLYKIIRLPRDRDDARPSVALERFVSVTYSPEAITMVCLETDKIADASLISNNWRVLQVKGPYEEQNAKQVEMIVRILRAANVEIFVSAAFDTDYLLLKQNQISQALDALEAAEQQIDHRLPANT